MELGLQRLGESLVWETRTIDGGWEVRDGDEIASGLVEEARTGVLSVTIDGTRSRVTYARQGNHLYLHLAGETFHLQLAEEGEDEGVDASGKDPVVRAPMPGKVVQLLVEVGATVEKGQPVVRVEAMKMEVDLPAPVTGEVATVHVAAGQIVEPDAALVTVEPAPES